MRGRERRMKPFLKVTNPTSPVVQQIRPSQALKLTVKPKKDEQQEARSGQPNTKVIPPAHDLHGTDQSACGVPGPTVRACADIA